MRLSKLFSGLVGLFMAGALAAQPAPEDLAAPAEPPPPPAVEAENVWNLDLSTGGRVSIQLRPDVAPGHVERIKTLTRQGFYDGHIFHRVIEGFMAQGGDPTGTGTGGSELPDLAAEIRGLPHVRGAVGMARGQDRDSANSQFYIMFVPRLTMDRDYTVFGRVTGGMAHVDAIERGEPPLNPTRIVRASIGSDNVAELSPEELRAAAERMAAASARPALRFDLAGGAAAATVEPEAVAEPVEEAQEVEPVEAAAEPAEEAQQAEEADEAAEVPQP